MPKAGNSQPSNEPSKATEPDLDGALKDLEILAQKPKKIAPDKVAQLGFEQIQTALAQGYSYTDIAKVFGIRGIRISAKNLKTEYEAIASSRSA